MKVALLTDGIYPYVLGGMQKHSYYLAKYLAINKVLVHLYHTGNKDADTAELQGFTKQELSYITPYYIPFPSVVKFPGHYVYESYLYSKLIYQQILINNSVDLIYSQGLTGWKTVFRNHGTLILPPTIVNLHGLNMYQYSASVKAKLESKMLRFATDTILKKSDYVISLGGKLTQILQDNGVAKNKILEIPIGIEDKWLVRQDKNNFLNRAKRKFVFIGRYDKVKGVELLSEVLDELKSAQYEFSFIGPIPEEKQLKLPTVHYLGLIKEEQQIQQVLREADVLVSPSYSEGMPTVILEAMASGLAIIATDVGAVSTMVSDENGWLIPAADKQALKQAIIEAINIDAKLLHQKKETSLRLVKENYTWDTIIRTTIDKISSIVNQP